MADRQQRLVFGEDAELYDRARADYPAELFDDLTELAGGPGLAVDVGSGTGKATVPLAERGWSGVAVEPDEAMAAVARRKLAPHPAWRVEVAEWERWPGPAGGADLVTCAQAWHWLDPASRFDRARRALRDGGLLALWWNRDGDNTDDETAAAQDRAIDAVYRAVVPGFVARGPGRKGAKPDTGDHRGFAVVLDVSYRWRRQQTADEFVATLHTQSDHRLLAPEVFARLAAGVVEAVDRTGGVVERTHRTDLWVAARESDPTQVVR